MTRRRSVDKSPAGRAKSTHLTQLRLAGGPGMLASVVIRKALIAVAAVVLVTGAAGAALAQVKGGVMRVGNLGEPPALDAHWTTASITETLTNHIYEGLYSLDKDKKPIPMLAESHTVSKDGLVYTFKLRQGIKFHNGKEM